jgi:hypothetical protein
MTNQFQPVGACVRFVHGAAHAPPARNATTTEPTMDDKPDARDEPEEKIPAFQLMLDNPFLLLFLGVAMPTVLYIVWGVMEIVGIPISPLGR